MSYNRGGYPRGGGYQDGGNYNAGRGGGYRGRGNQDGGNYHGGRGDGQQAGGYRGGRGDGQRGGGAYRGGGGGDQGRTYSDMQVSRPIIDPRIQYDQHPIRSTKEEKIITNAYDLELPKRAVYKYELKFFAVYPPRNNGLRRLLDLSTFERLGNAEIQDIGTGGEQFDSRSFAVKEFLPNSRRQCITKLYDQLFVQYGDDFQAERLNEAGDGYFHVYAYDRSSIFYCSHKIKPRDTYLNCFNITVGELHQDVRGQLKQPQEIFATLKLTGLVDPQVAEANQVKTYLDILFSQKQLDDVERFVKFGPKVFDLKSRVPEDVRTSCNLKDGQQKSVNMGAGSLQIDASISPFHTSVSLAEYINARFGFTDQTNFAEDNVLRALGTLKGLFVRTTHLQINDLFRIESITAQSSRDVTFFLNADGQQHQISVADYYLQKYQRELEYPQLPCVQKLKTRLKHPETGEVTKTYSYYPIELLLVQQGQKYRREDMTVEQERVMIAQSQRRPLELMNEIGNQKNLAHLVTSDNLVRSAQVVIGENMKQVPAEVLTAPVITYANAGSGKKINFAEWDVNRTHFVRPAEIKALLVIYDRRSEDLAYKLEEEILKRMGDFGMQVGAYDFVPLNDLSYDSLKSVILEKRNNYGVDFVFAIGSGSQFHHDLKATEAATNVKTQQIEPKTLLNKGKPIGGATKGNILSKTNPKNGGYNQFFQQNVSGGGIDVLRSFVNRTLIIGIQISHPSPGMEGRTPSVCGYSYNIHDTGNVARGGFLYLDMNPPDENSANHARPKSSDSESSSGPPQSPDEVAASKAKVLKYEHLSKILEKAIESYRAARDMEYPERVLIYRFGTSEGEFNKIQSEECGAAQNILNGYSENAAIKLTVILVLRQHNIRLFKNPGDIDRNARAPQQNVAPGTCVAGNKENEFVIVAHRALQGTAKPTLYSVIYPKENNDLPVNLLKNVTHTLCYMHEIVPSAISVPAHIRNAEQMATRGRNLWKTRDYETDDPQEIDPTPFYDHATSKLQPTFPTRYWA